ncbi:MAG TPA: N-acetyltransferase [Candidatus Saccharimonadia bacterium]|nr:N-acetyltransferase [Candidatus Saccharimonadia bacterium]
MFEELASIGVTFREVTPQDEDFLCRLYASTREEELSVTGWPRELKAEFLRQQFQAQSAHYDLHYRSAGADFRVILLHGVPQGRLYIYQSEKEIRLVDIALMPETRGKGVGTAVLHHVLATAAQACLPVTIHVEKNNPAMNLYKRLGFSAVGEHGCYDLMACPTGHLIS